MLSPRKSANTSEPMRAPLRQQLAAGLTIGMSRRREPADPSSEPDPDCTCDELKAAVPGADPGADAILPASERGDLLARRPGGRAIASQDTVCAMFL